MHCNEALATEQMGGQSRVTEPALGRRSTGLPGSAPGPSARRAPPLLPKPFSSLGGEPPAPSCRAGPVRGPWAAPAVAACRREGRGWWKEAALNHCRAACSPAACRPSLLQPCAGRPGAPAEGAGREDPSRLCLSSGRCLTSHTLTQHPVGNPDPCTPAGTAHSLLSPLPPRPGSCPAV